MASSTRTDPTPSALEGAHGGCTADFAPLQSLSVGLMASQQLMSFFASIQQAQVETIKHMTESLAQAIEEAREARDPARIFAIQTQLAVDQMTYLVNQNIKLFSQASGVLAEVTPAASPVAGGPAAQDATNALAAPLAMLQKMPQAWLDWARQWNATMGDVTRPT